MLQSDDGVADSEDQGYNETFQDIFMGKCDDRIVWLKEGIQRLEEYEKMIQCQSEVPQTLQLQDGELQDKDLRHLEEQYESLQQQLKVAQMELVQQGKLLEEAKAELYSFVFLHY